MDPTESEREYEENEINKKAKELRKKRKIRERAFPDEDHSVKYQKTINQYNIAMPKIMCNHLTKIIQNHARLNFQHPDQMFIGSDLKNKSLLKERMDYDKTAN